MDLRHSTHERAVEVIQAAGNPVCLLVQSLVHLVRPRHDQEYRCTSFPFHPHLLRIFSHCISIIVDYLTIWFSYRIVDDLGVYNWQFELFNLILQCSYIILYRYGSSVSAVVVDMVYRKLSSFVEFLHEIWKIRQKYFNWKTSAEYLVRCIS